jgi:hypothetical protein
MLPVLEVFTLLDVWYEGKRLTKLPFRKIRALGFLFLVLVSMVTVISFLPKTEAATSITLSPSEGHVGAKFDVRATINTSNAMYEIFWDDNRVASENATGTSVNVTLTVPPAVVGNHSVTVRDVDINENATSNFKILTAYSFETLPEIVSPAQRQEGDPFNVSLTMTGGEQGKTNVANVTVKVPNNASYTCYRNITTESDGNGSLLVSYPLDFSTGANTNFTGNSQVLLNGTLATEIVFVGLTSSSEYHRNQTIDIKAVYNANEDVTLTISGKDLNYSQNMTADSNGLVTYANSTMLSNASMGVYTVNITSTSNPTRKAPPDVQSFTVPGFDVNVTMRNLAAEPISSVTVYVFENAQSITNATSDSTGLTLLKLEIGSYMCNASYNDQKVGDFSIQINDSASFDLNCNLTNLRVIVVDEDGIRIPGIDLHLKPENQTFFASIAQTDINGTSVAHSLLPVVNDAFVNYTLNASRYETQFSTITNISLPIAPWFELNVICPKISLQVNVTSGTLNPISGAQVNLTEVRGGLQYFEATGVDGGATFSCTLGKYLVEIYDQGGIKLNETTVNLNQTANLSVSCSIYGLDISIRVVDYFGQPIPNVNVTLQRTGQRGSHVAGADGLASFSNIVGGSTQVTVRLSGQSDPCVVTTTYLDSSRTIELKIDRYVALAGMLLETAHLLTFIIVVLIVVAILCLEVLRRRRLKPQKSDS